MKSQKRERQKAREVNEDKTSGNNVCEKAWIICENLERGKLSREVQNDDVPCLHVLSFKGVKKACQVQRCRQFVVYDAFEISFHLCCEYPRKCICADVINRQFFIISTALPWNDKHKAQVQRKIYAMMMVTCEYILTRGGTLWFML